MTEDFGKKLLHPSFQKVWDQTGSGYYFYSTRLGMGSIFYLSSTDVFPYNPPQERASSPYYDFYDALRAVESGYFHKLEHKVESSEILLYSNIPVSGRTTEEIIGKAEITRDGDEVTITVKTTSDVLPNFLDMGRVRALYLSTLLDNVDPTKAKEFYDSIERNEKRRASLSQ